MTDNQTPGSWVPVGPVLQSVPTSGLKPKWTYLPNEPPKASPANTGYPPTPSADSSPGIFFIRDTVASPIQEGQVSNMCWVVGSPPVGWAPPPPPPHPYPSPPPPPPARNLAPSLNSSGTVTWSSTLPVFDNGWILIPQPLGGWTSPPPPPPPPPSTPELKTADPASPKSP